MTYFFSNKIIFIKKKKQRPYLLAVLAEEESQHQDVDQRDEEGGVRVELVLLHEDVGTVAQVEVGHDDAHPDHGLQAQPESRGARRRGRLPLLQALHVGGHGPAMAPVTQHLQQQQKQGRAQEEAGQELLQQVGGRQRLAAGALDGPHQLVAHSVDDNGGALVGGHGVRYYLVGESAKNVWLETEHLPCAQADKEQQTKRKREKTGRGSASKKVNRSTKK